MWILKTKRIDYVKMIDTIYNSDLPTSVKVVRLYAIAMLNYGQEIGDAAIKKMKELIGEEAVNAFFFLSGFLSDGEPTTEDYRKLLYIGGDE